MSVITWTQSLETGNPDIDNDHRNLIAKIDTMLDAIAKGRTNDALADTVEELIRYTHEHFAREEAEMQRIGYCDMPLHVKEHGYLLQ
ncbi:MAG: bacteriohemerythrin, partial [Rhodoferax sp.]